MAGAFSSARQRRGKGGVVRWGVLRQFAASGKRFRGGGAAGPEGASGASSPGGGFGEPPVSAVNSLQSKVSRLRTSIGSDRVRRVPAGYLLDLPGLKGVLPGWTPMKPNTALCFLINGLALAFSIVPDIQPIAQRLGAAARYLRAGSNIALLA